MTHLFHQFLERVTPTKIALTHSKSSLTFIFYLFNIPANFCLSFIKVVKCEVNNKPRPDESTGDWSDGVAPGAFKRTEAIISWQSKALVTVIYVIFNNFFFCNISVVEMLLPQGRMFVFEYLITTDETFRTDFANMPKIT